MKREELTINGLQVTTLGASSGPKALFLHGGPGLFSYMERLCEAVTPFCRPIFYDQRGSKQTDAIIGIEDHLADLAMIVDRSFPDSRPILVGHSWGAMLAVLFASRHADQTDKVIAVASGPLNRASGSAFTKELLRRFGERRPYLDDLWKALVSEADASVQPTLACHYLQEVFPFYQPGSGSLSDLGPLHWDFKASWNTMMESDAYIDTDTYAEAVSKIPCSITVIHGSRDPLPARDLFPIFAQHQPSAKLHEIDGAGHYPWIGGGAGPFMRILLREIVDSD